jgi:hypothetical protein
MVVVVVVVVVVSIRVPCWPENMPLVGEYFMNSGLTVAKPAASVEML